MASNPVSNKDDPAYAGNELFVQKEYEKALDEYSKSIEKHPDVAKLYSNRAMTYWKLNRPYDAWKDAEAGLKLEPNNEKLIYRKCPALLEMRRFHEASEFLDDALLRIGDVPEKYKNEFQSLIDDMERLKSEFVNGRYDLMTMVEESKTSPILSKHADYIAWNKFEIREVDGKGRGLVAKERIELGELLIACEAFVFVPIPVPVETADNVMVGEARKKLLHRPDLGEQFYRLYAGPELGHLENWTEGEPMDLERMAGVIVHNNCYLDRGVLFYGSTVGGARHMGISIIPSYINNSCVDFNCDRYFVGNFTFVRATKAIEKGEEIVFSYIRLDQSFEERQECLYGFECHCGLCQIERQASIDVKKRVNEIRQFLVSVTDRAIAARRYHPSDIQLLERFAEELQQRRPGLSFDFLAFRVRGALASSVLSDRSSRKASIPMLKKLIDDLKSAGDFIHARFMTKSLIIVAMDSGSKRDQDEAKKLAREIAKMYFGDERVADL